MYKEIRSQSQNSEENCSETKVSSGGVDTAGGDSKNVSEKLINKFTFQFVLNLRKRKYKIPQRLKKIFF